MNWVLLIKLMLDKSIHLQTEYYPLFLVPVILLRKSFVFVLSFFFTSFETIIFLFVFLGFVKLWDVRQAEQPVAVFRPTIGTVDCFTVTLGQTSYNDKIVAAGFDNGDIKIFDLRNMAVVKEVNITVGVSIFSSSFDF